MPAVVVKKAEKVSAVFAAMSDSDDMLEFKAKFKELFPKEWQHINSVYQKKNVPI